MEPGQMGTTNSTVEYTEINNSTPVSVQSKPTNSAYTHPFIECIHNSASEEEMINTMEVFMGTTPADTPISVQPSYYVIDQMEFIVPVLHVFSNAVSIGKLRIIQWLMNNYVPLDVSYDDNFFYKDAIKTNQNDSADLIITHPSFKSDMYVLENLLDRRKYDAFKKLVTKTDGPIQSRAPTLCTYIDNGEIDNVRNLFNIIQIEESARSHTII